MSMLEDIQSAAIDSKADLGPILRKCKVLAARLGSAPLEEWIIWESNGYPDSVRVPNYRIWPVQLTGHFAGPFGSGIQYAPVPLASLPEKVRPQYEKWQCRQSIASLETAIQSGKTSFQLNTGDLSLILGGDVYQGQNCVKVWAEFGAGNVVEVLNAVRNRILDFAIAIWKECPTAGELGKTGTREIESAHVSQIFQTIVYDGGIANVVGSVSNSAFSQSIVKGDFSSLRSELKKQGVSDDDILDLHSAVTEESKAPAKDRFGPKVASWIGKMVKKAAEGTWSVGITVAGKIATDALSKYYGLS